MNEDLTPQDIERGKRTITDESLNILGSFFEHLRDVKSFITLAKRIETKNTYRHLIDIGVKAEELIEKMRQQLDERSELELAHKTAEQRLIAAKIMAADLKDEFASKGKRKAPDEIGTLTREVEKAAKKLKEVPEVKFDYDELNSLLLQVTDFTIKVCQRKSLAYLFLTAGCLGC